MGAEESNPAAAHAVATWDRKVAWMRRVAAVRATWNEGGDLLAVELGPDPSPPALPDEPFSDPDRMKIRAGSRLVRVPGSP